MRVCTCACVCARLCVRVHACRSLVLLALCFGAWVNWQPAPMSTEEMSAFASMRMPFVCESSTATFLSPPLPCLSNCANTTMPFPPSPPFLFVLCLFAVAFHDGADALDQEALDDLAERLGGFGRLVTMDVSKPKYASFLKTIVCLSVCVCVVCCVLCVVCCVLCVLCVCCVCVVCVLCVLCVVCCVCCVCVCTYSHCWLHLLSLGPVQDVSPDDFPTYRVYGYDIPKTDFLDTNVQSISYAHMCVCVCLLPPLSPSSLSLSLSLPLPPLSVSPPLSLSLPPSLCS